MVVRLDLPDALTEPATHRPSDASAPGLDPHRLAHAVENLIRAIDPAGRTLSVDGRTVVLTRREFDLLAYLQDHRGVALSRRELMTAVWQTDYLIGDRTIDVHIRRLRVKLGRYADRLSTLRGFGYRFD